MGAGAGSRDYSSTTYGRALGSPSYMCGLSVVSMIIATDICGVAVFRTV